MQNSNSLNIKEAFKKAEISDWMNDSDIINIAAEVSKLDINQVYVEIGVAYGASSALACLVAKPGVRIYAIDVLDQPGRDKNIETVLGVYGKALKDCDYNFIHADSQFTARYWDKGEIDVLYIDGDHEYEGVIKDIISWLPWVKKGGTIIFDDYVDNIGVKRAINELLVDHKAYQKTYADSITYIIKK